MKVFFGILFSIAALNVQSDDFSNEKKFIQEYINSSEEIELYFNESFNNTSKRFGISYYNTPYKILADKNLSLQQRSGLTIDDFTFENLEQGYTLSRLNKASADLEFYFLDGKFIPDIFYKIRDYKSEDTKYLKIFTNKDDSLNETAKSKLDEFVFKFIQDFKMNELIPFIEKEKIFYVYAETQEEIETLIGVKSRGIFLISTDIVVSNYPCHYHELCHFMINLKLRNDIKPSVPLFLEGLAVAFGGRGGVSSNVEIEVGRYLLSSGFVNVSEFLQMNSFFSHDLSIAYSVSGYLVKSIYERYGLEYLLEQYQKYSSESGMLGSITIDSSIFDLNFMPENKIKLASENVTSNPIFESPELKIFRNGEKYEYQSTANYILMSDNLSNKESKLFSQKFPDAKYNSERYLIECGESSISIYDLHTEELMAMLNSGFMIEPVEIKTNGAFNFSLESGLFDEEISKYNIYLKK